MLSTFIEGETRDVAAMHAAIAKEILTRDRPARRPRVRSIRRRDHVHRAWVRHGRGRNQEFVLAAAIALQGAPGVTILSGGTDGIDGPTDAAGAIADGDTVAKAAAVGFDAKRVPCQQRLVSLLRGR